ncbi:hypothetical protein [Aquabacterium sp.]|uniref:hypothetical protein n=1 Tax=Aquabacterium sp. TaxID=1872578 RepID=UPI002C5A3077|nr:hypothetical protein [Aquabacterium sp.]HSW08740.1 hypothetical protein [Aquabacterium sp.]
MTGLRDARLHKALESAPDGDMRPAERVRREILAKAHQAVAPASAVPWWKALWESAGRRNSPWNAAFATLVIAGFVTVLWFDREVPGPLPETTQAGAPVPSAATPAPPVPPAAPAPTSAAETASPATTAPAQIKPAKPATDAATRAAQSRPAEMAQARKSEPALSARQSGPAQEAAGGAEPARERRADTKSLRDEDTRALAKSAQPQAEAAAPATAPLQGSVGAAAGTAAAPRAAPMARPAAPVQAAPAAPAPAPVIAPQRDAMASGWTHAKVSVGGREVEVERSQAGRLAALLGAIERGPRGEDPLEGPVALKIELSEQGAPVDALEVVGAQVRWARLRAGQRSSFVAKPEPAQLQALQAEVNRLTGR